MWLMSWGVHPAMLALFWDGAKIVSWFLGSTEASLTWTQEYRQLGIEVGDIVDIAASCLRNTVCALPRGSVRIPNGLVPCFEYVNNSVQWGAIISWAQSVGASLNDHVLMQTSDADAGEIHQFGWLVALLTSQGYDENTWQHGETTNQTGREAWGLLKNEKRLFGRQVRDFEIVRPSHLGRSLLLVAWRLSW
jgi:hypothetical protein